MLLYLNDKFDDGETCFWTDYATVDSNGHCRFIRDQENAEADVIVKPKQGSALINDHVIMHEGVAPKKGVKYILRTDIVHEKEVTKNMIDKTNQIKKGEVYSEWIRHYEPSCLNYTE